MSRAISISEVYPASGSTAGGTYLVIRGSGFAFPGEFNPWDSQSVSVGAVPCKVIPHFSSSTEIVCMTGPSAPFATTAMQAVSVQNFYGLGVAEYATKAAAFRYDALDTPSISFATTWAASGGDVVAFAGEIQSDFDSAEQLEIKLGEALCRSDQEERPLESRRRRGSTKKVRCILPNDMVLRPGRYNMSVRMKILDPNQAQCPNSACFPRNLQEGKSSDRGFGNGPVILSPPLSTAVGRLHLPWGGSPDLETGQLYHFTVYPQVEVVEPAEGGLHGGNNLTLRGSSFSEVLGDNEVTVGGVPCTVLAATVGELVCRLGDRSNYTGGRGGALRGLYYATYRAAGGARAWNAADNRTIPAVLDRVRYKTGLLKGQADFVNRDEPYNSDNDLSDDNYMRETTGFFVPPLTATYTFYIAGDDVVTLELGASAEASSLQRVATCRSFVNWQQGNTENGPSTFYSFADIDKDLLAGPAYQVSSPLALVAGQRYAFRLRHTAWGGYEWTRFGLRIGGLSGAAKADGSRLDAEAAGSISRAFPAMEVKRLRLRMKASLRREMHFIEIANYSSGGDFRLRLTSSSGQEAFLRLQANVNQTTIRDAIQNVKVIVSGKDPSSLHGCGSVVVSTASAGVVRTFNVTLQCILPPGSTSLVTIAVESSSQTAVRAGVLQRGSLPMGGTFRVGYGGLWSQPMSARTSTIDWPSMANAISSMSRINADGERDLEMEAWPGINTWPAAGEGFDMWVRFRLPRWNVSELELDNSEVLGEDYEIDVKTIEKSDEDAAVLDRVPMDFFEMPYPDDPGAAAVRIVTNGVLGGSKGAVPPSYTYKAELTPMLLGVSPEVVAVGSSLTLIVADNASTFLDDFAVLIGDSTRCDDVANVEDDNETIITLTCTVQSGRAGLYPVTLLSRSRGAANPILAPMVTYAPAITSVSPSAGSLVGGTAISIMGDGLLGLPCSAVTIGGTPCREVASAGLSSSVARIGGDLICLTPGVIGFDVSSNTSLSPQASTHKVAVLERSSGVTFTYTSASTPLIQSISPVAHSAARSVTITLSGEMLGGGSEPPMVLLNSRPCTVSFFVDGEVTCWLQRATPNPPKIATQRPQMWVAGLGYAAVGSEASFDYRFEVHGVTSPLGSNAGGAIINISGMGFHPTLPEDQTVVLALPDGTERPCAVVGGTATTLQCEVQGGAASSDGAGRRLGSGAEPAEDERDCERGGMDRAKLRCFAKAVFASGTLRSSHGADKRGVGASLAKLAGPLGGRRTAAIGQDAWAIPHAGQGGESAEPDVVPRRLSSVSGTGDEAEGESADFLGDGRLVITMNGVTAACVDRNTTGEAGCRWGFADEMTPQVMQIYPRNGTHAAATRVAITLLTHVNATNARVFFGNHECDVAAASRDEALNATVLEVPLCAFAASTLPVRVLVAPYGYAVGASPYTGMDYTFQQELEVHSLSPAGGSVYGGTLLTLRGSGFGATADANRVTVGTLPCKITSASNSEVQCYAPNLVGGEATKDVLLAVLTKVPPVEWTLGRGFGSCVGSAFDAENGAGAQPKAEPEPEPETEPEPEVEPEPAVSGFTVVGAGNIRMHKAACPSSNGNVTDAETPVPTGAASFGITFKIQEPCSSWCSPLWVTLRDAADPSKFYRWCFNKRDGGECDAEPAVAEQVWHLRQFQVGAFATKHNYEPELLKLSIGVYAVAGTATTYINEVIFEELAPPQTFTFGPASTSPKALALRELPGGMEVEVTGRSFGSEVGLVALGTDGSPTGNLQCAPTFWNDTLITCTRSPAPAGGWQVRVWTPSKGWSDPAPTLLWVSTVLAEARANGDVVNLTNSSSIGSLYAGFGGNIELTLRGTGLGFDPPNMEIAVCGEPCRITEAINTTTATCVTPARRSEELINAYPSAFPPADLAPDAARFYTDRGIAADEAFVAQNAFTLKVDGAIDLYYNGRWNTRSGCWFGFELPLHKRARVTSAEFFPPTNALRRSKVQHSVFEVRNLTDGSNWRVVAKVNTTVITGSTIAQGWSSYAISPPVSAQSFRIRLLPDACVSQGELMRGVRFTGVLLDFNESKACPIELRRVSHPLANYTGVRVPISAQMVHTLARTPVVAMVAPNRGTARGETLVELQGSGLQPLGAGGAALVGPEDVASVQVVFNGYSCSVVEATANSTRCNTAERDQGITPPSTVVWVAGRGHAIIAGSEEATTFKYIDKWSNVYSWQASEPPVDGDSVIIPEGQAILLDRDSPRLFFVLVSGLLEFDRRDLAFNATYIWIAGGHLMVGTEDAPFMHRATITLHGTRWYTIELPHIGAKMIAVTNLGGLHGGCHTEALRTDGVRHAPCYVRKVGRLDLHGRPGVSWTRLVQTVRPNETVLRLEEPVNWPVGARVVVTPSQRGEDEEVRRVANVSDDGLEVTLDEPLEHEHLGEWWFHASVATATDLRAAVGLLTRNIKVQGDDESAHPGNSYMFGAHMAVFFGGVMRVENVEYFRTGQSANFGRYSSHWHNLSPGRTVDVVDLAYLRNNSYHDTFQRAVVVHGTDYCVVRDNVAHRTKGHSFFTEQGDEHYPLFKHNLAINPQPHHLLLADDVTPAGFWLPGFTGLHVNNLAANCVRGWRLQKLEGVASMQTDLTFFNNSAHACGFGWHLKPPHGPSTLNTFASFTAFRCETGMFYYGTGNIRHEDHRFVECGTGHFMNHLTNDLQTAPFYTNMILVGNINPAEGFSHSYLGIRAPKDNEYFFVSGMKVINYFTTPVLYGCFDTVCTMRFERAEWYNSTRRTLSDPEICGIFWDLDGSLTGYPNGFVTFDKPFNHFPGVCAVQPEHVGGIVCGKADGSVRMRRLWVRGQQPWQLDGKAMNITTSAGTGYVSFAFLKLYGWGIPVVSTNTYDMRPNVANDFSQLTLDYATWPYVFENHGWLHTSPEPANESIVVNLNFTSWRNHYDARLGPRLGRMPTIADPFGAHSMKLWADMCAVYNLSKASAAVCNGEYTNETGWGLKKELEEYIPRLPEPDGRVTVVLTMRGRGGNGTAYKPEAGMPSEGAGTYQALTARECPVAGCPTPTPAPLPPGQRRMWSDATGWPNKQLPKANENVVINASDWVALDMETPELYWVTVEGRLEFSRAHNATLHAHAVKVWGTLELGTQDSPMPAGSRAEVVLHGDESDQTVVMTEGFFLVNKVVAVVGNLSAVGTPSSSAAWTKLDSTANVGATTLVVRGDVSKWPAGARVAIAATEYPQPPETTETEVRTIVTSPVYSAVAGTTTLQLNAALNNRHFAGDVSGGEVGGHWPSSRLAAAVAVLGGRSNVIFRTAVEGDVHGGSVVIGGSADGVWRGAANISNVDFVAMGKFYHQAPALQWLALGASIGQMPPSRVQRCVFSLSQGGAIEINGASDLEIIENAFHRTYRTAVWITKESIPDSITVRGNVAIETLRHPRESTDWFRPFAAFLLEVPLRELAGNLAAGSTNSGFVIRPKLSACAAGDVGSPRLAAEQLNEAVACVEGFFILRACKETCESCAQLRGAIAWKSSHAGVITVDQSSSFRLEALLLSDNHIGLSLNFNREWTDLTHRVFAHNVTVFGSSSASTCNASMSCRALGREDVVGVGCNSVAGDAFRRIGIMTHMVNNQAKLCEANPKLPVCRPPNTPVKLCVMPWEHRLGTVGSRYSEAHWSSVTFGHFTSNDCGKRSMGFAVNPTAIDTAFPQHFSGVRWLSSASSDSRLLLDVFPVPSGQNRMDMAATDDGVMHLVLVDVDGSLLGTGRAGGSALPLANPELATANCEGRPGYYACDGLKLRYLKWEAVGSPAHRTLGSYKAWRQSDGRATWSRGGHADSCLSDEPREGERGWQMRVNDQYNLTMFAQNLPHHRLQFFNADPDPVRLDMFLSQPFRFEVYVDGQLLGDSYDMAKSVSPPRYPTLEDPHGSFAFDAQERRFFLTMRGGSYGGKSAAMGGGSILLRLLQVVQLSLTLSIPVTDFDGPGLVKNVATLLGIDPARIKIVSVQSRAQVAAQGGRSLQAANDTSIVVHIVEANPPPLSSSLLSGGTVPEPPGSGTNGTANSTEEAAGFSTGALSELQSLATLIQSAAASGTLSQALGAEVSVEVLVSNPEGVTTSTLTTTGTATATSSASASGLSTTTEAVALAAAPVAAGSDDSQTVAIVIGAVVGAVAGAAMMLGGLYYLKRSRRESRQAIIRVLV